MPEWEEIENGARSHAACQCWMCNDISSQKFIVVLYSSGKNFTNLASEIGSIVMVQESFSSLTFYI